MTDDKLTEKGTVTLPDGKAKGMSVLLQNLVEKGFDPKRKYSTKEIYGKPMQRASGHSRWGTIAHRNTVGARINKDSIPYDHKVGVDESGRKYLDTNIEALPEHPRWDTDPVGTKYTIGTQMEFFRKNERDDFEFIGISGGRDGLEKIDAKTMRMYLQW
ncbi:MAG: hypothetical protein FWB99_01590 [Treponema sp.]|nr:hypothetical protein [Treponema sp.]